MNLFNHVNKTRILLSVVFGVGISVIIGIVIFNEFFAGRDSSEDIKNAEIQINQTIFQIKDNEAKGVFGYDEAVWSKIKNIGDGLCYKNRKIANAKFFAHAPKPKFGNVFDEISWEERFSEIRLDLAWGDDSDLCFGDEFDRILLSRRPWKIYEPWEMLVKCIGAGVISILLTIPLSWLAIFIVSWVWYFFLDRIRELSNAFRGHVKMKDTIIEKPIEKIPAKEKVTIIAKKPDKEHKKRGTRWLFFWENILLPINILAGIFGIVSFCCGKNI